MKFSLELPIEHIQYGSEFVGQDALVEMAQTAEAAGFDACCVTDHPVPTARWLDGGGHYAQDPFVMLSMAAAVTKRIRVQTFLLVLPYRNPFVMARAVASLDAFSGGRVTLAIGAGYLKGEFKALGVDFERRNEITDEALRAMITAWTQDEFSFEGTGYSAQNHRILPHPIQKPHPPIWVGGNSKRAIRRAVDLGQGWVPFPAPAILAKTARTAAMESVDDLKPRLAYMRDYAKEAGTPVPKDIVGPSFTPWARDPSQSAAFLDEVKKLAAVGATWINIQAPGKTRKEWCDNARRLADDVRQLRG